MNTIPAQDTSTPYPFGEALAETTRRYELAISAVLRADHLLSRLAMFAATPSDVNRELLAEAVARTLPAVHTALGQAGIRPLSARAFARYEVTPAGEAALSAVEVPA
jgi:hypothetical protein